MSPAARISLIYVIVSAVWITTSDTVLDLLVRGNTDMYSAAQTVKGWFFVAVTAGLLYLFLKHEFDARQRSEKQVVEREATFHELFANNPLPMYVFDRATLTFLDVNESMCARYGYSRDEFLSMKITEIRPPDEVPRLLNYMDQLGTGFKPAGEWRHRTKGGQLFTVHVTAQTFVFAGKQAALVVVQDITEQKHAETERLENERLRLSLVRKNEIHGMRSRFISMVSHEFRRPLTTITSSIDLLEHYRGRMTEDGAQKHFDRIHEQLGEMKELLDDFLTLMQEESGELELKRVSVDLVALCNRLIDELKLTISDRHSIDYTSDFKRAEIQGDEKLLRQAIGNLLSNAVKYSPEGGQIRLALKHNENIEIYVSDQGIGIPPEDQAQIFDIFYRASNVGSLNGTGLGLAIARQAVELHGGSLAIARSNASGTEFVLSLPVDEHVFLTGC